MKKSKVVKTKKTNPAKKVKAKIAYYLENVHSLEIVNNGKGTEVEMLDKDENYIKKAFTQFKKAQQILEKYYQDAQKK